MCVIFSCASEEFVQGGEGEDLDVDHPAASPTHPLTWLASAGCAVTLTNTCTLLTLHVTVHTLPTHLLLAALIATKRMGDNFFQ